jgi:pseudouridine-5'-phosphate glycosidase
VALESTIITHGMPYPQNLETARAGRGHRARAGAVPATIAVLDGALHIGLTDAALERWRRRGGAKLARRSGRSASPPAAPAPRPSPPP